MAKQLGIIQFRDKLGELVGNKKSAGQRFNTIRQRVLEIKNPATAGQRAQRLKLLPAQNFYRALAEIIDHSFQGKAKGGPCHSAFMQKAMLMEADFPYLTKGDNRAVPGEYMIAQGGLNPVEVTFGKTEGGPNAPFIAAGWLPEAPNNSFTVGQASQYILEHNPVLRDGDQLTFVMCMTDQPGSTSASFIYKYFRMVLNVASEENYYDFAEAQGVNVDLDYDKMFYIESMEGYTCVAGACIVSRRPRSAGGAWQRSTTYMKVSDDVKNIFMSARALEGSLASYEKKDGSISSDLYLNQAGSDDTAVVSMRTVTLTATTGGTVTGAGSYEYGAAVSIQAIPAQGYVFDGWYEGDVLKTTDNPYNFILASNVSFEAHFSLNDQP